MKIKKIFPELLYKDPKLVITFQSGENQAIARCFQKMEGIDPKKDYDVIIKPIRRKRSLDANAYMWVLIGKLGEKLYKPDSEVYREFIKDNGVFEIVPIREDAVGRWIETWEKKGIGWVCEDMGECRNLKGYHNIKCYYGSSTYNTAEMSRLIDAVVYECKLQDIETITPDELERMKQEWGCS